MHKRLDPTGYSLILKKASWMAENYEWCFAPLVGKNIKLLELGVYNGASLLLWRDYFENGTIVGIDINRVNIGGPTDGIHIYQGKQQDIQLLDRVAQEQAPEGFDVIIDDCSHIGRLTRVSFWHLFDNHLKPGGLYAIEDWTTGYLDSFPDGRRYRQKSRILSTCIDYLQILLVRISVEHTTLFPGFLSKNAKWFSSKIPSHTYGMVGFVKEIIDAYVKGSIVSPRSGNGRYRHYTISNFYLSKKVLVVRKATEKQK